MVMTRLEYLQKSGPGQLTSVSNRVASLTPTRWFYQMKMSPGKPIVAFGLWWTFVGGWGIEFIQNMSVMTKEKPPIDWNNEKLGYLKRS